MKPEMNVWGDDPALLEQLANARKANRDAIRRVRSIYYGMHPCAERDANPAFDAACSVAEKARDDCNVIIDEINRLRQERRQRGELRRKAA